MVTRRTYIGVAALMLTTVLWGSSFPFIKIVVPLIGEYRYVWLRSLIAMAGLAPYIAYRAAKRRLGLATIRGGLVTGVAYTIGLWLQGWGTGLTTASNSAFITGLNVVFIHLYEAFFRRSYSYGLAASLALSVSGLYLLSRPTGGLGVGDILVLLGAVAWAAQVILVSKYSSGDPMVFVFFEMAPGLVFALAELGATTSAVFAYTALPYVLYLGLVCSDTAFASQVYGQRYVSPAAAGIIFLLEPVYAAIFANRILGETLTWDQLAGALLILSALFISVRETTVEKR